MYYVFVFAIHKSLGSIHTRSKKSDFICREDRYHMSQRKLYVAKTKRICCKDKMYMLQRQTLYAIKTNLYVIKTKF